MSLEQYNLVHLAHRFIYLFTPSEPLVTAEVSSIAQMTYPSDHRLRDHSDTKTCSQLLRHLLRAGVRIKKDVCKNHNRKSFKLRLKEPARSAREKIDTYFGYPSVDSVNLIRRTYEAICGRQEGVAVRDVTPRCMYEPSPFQGLRGELISRVVLREAVGYSPLYVHGHTALLHDLLEGRLAAPELHLVPLARSLFGNLPKMVRAADHARLEQFFRRKAAAEAMRANGYPRSA